MPQNLIQDSGVKNAAEALDPELRLVTGSANEALILKRLDELPERVIDMLAWQYHVDFYELAPDIIFKRQMIREAIIYHMKKGTRFAILRALDMLGIDAEYQNWYEFGGQPYTFRIKASVRAEYYKKSNREQIIANIKRAINDSKAARSWMAELETGIHEWDNLNIYHGIGQGLTGRYIIKISEPHDDTSIKYYSGFGQGLSGRRIMKDLTPETELSTGLFAGFAFTLRGWGHIRAEKNN